MLILQRPFLKILHQLLYYITNDIYLMSHINIYAEKSFKCTASRLRLFGNNKQPDAERYKMQKRRLNFVLMTC